MVTPAKPLVVVVTGANSGLGFGICERLLLQLSGGLPPLSTFTSDEIDAVAKDFTTADSLILVLACRNEKRAHDARERLLRGLDSNIQRRRDHALHERGVAFRRSLVLKTADLDLTRVESVFSFCKDMLSTHDYITHMFLNAGTGDFTGVDLPHAIYQILTEGSKAVAYPAYKLERQGSVTNDGLGLVWQSNVFGHYMMVRLLTPLLQKSPFGNSRLAWTTSLEARTDSAQYEAGDVQLIKTTHPYEGSKYQQELLSIELDRQFAENESTRGIRSFIFEPGVIATSIYVAQLGWFLDKLMIMAFYLARWSGSTFHVISTYKAAVTAINIALLSSGVLPKAGEPTMLCSRANRVGKEFSENEHVDWEAEKAVVLAAYCERLYQALLVKHSDTEPSLQNGTTSRTEGNGKAH